MQQSAQGTDGVVDDDTYFAYYSRLSIHREMLADEQRTTAYRTAIDLSVKDKVVLDVGCGTGILSLIAARAGAKCVYAIEASDMADVARRIVTQNGLDSIVKVLKGKIEDLHPPQQVDVLISEWMGDRWLRLGGQMIPSRANVYVALVDAEDQYNKEVRFWRRVEGFDMSALQTYAASAFFRKELKVSPVKPQTLLSNVVCISSIDCGIISLETIDSPRLCSGRASLTVSKASQAAYGIAVWFDTELTSKTASHPAVVLATGPDVPRTHWEQSLLPFGSFKSVEENASVEVELSLGIHQVNKRHIEVDLQVNFPNPADHFSHIYSY